ncbi:hypothetical protein NW762_006549 [Fusarium torreyae]|uniref:Uncharacterized protein n=1 Tax=Fusarium torreyae TaxID=1237075 RepID=A0A9W8S1L7_9HYPO|nr:hypothetical protein NW762_006549 [Fusarium torreyae]
MADDDNNKDGRQGKGQAKDEDTRKGNADAAQGSQQNPAAQGESKVSLSSLRAMSRKRSSLTIDGMREDILRNRAKKKRIGDHIHQPGENGLRQASVNNRDKSSREALIRSLGEHRVQELEDDLMIRELESKSGGYLLLPPGFGSCGQGQDQGGSKVDAPERQRICSGCGSKTHDLARCLKAGPDGLMRGCPRCNVLGHTAAQCIRLENHEDKAYFLITGRGNMPSFLDIATVGNVVRAVSKTGGQANGIPEQFPWTPEFTKSLAPDIESLQNDLDRFGLDADAFNGFKLPVDPDMKDWTAVQATCDRLSSGGSFVTPRDAAVLTRAARKQVSENIQYRLEIERINKMLDEEGEPEDSADMEPVF